MTNVRLELPNPNTFTSVQAYIEEHVVPVVTELHRLTNELLAPGSTAEEFVVDMVPSDATPAKFSRLDRQLASAPKHVTFDGKAYFNLPQEIMRQKQVKVQLTALVYVKGGGGATFRLVKDDGEVIENSTFEVVGTQLRQISRTLPFGLLAGSISPDESTYFIEAKRVNSRHLPVCRRFSLSFVYI